MKSVSVSRRARNDLELLFQYLEAEGVNTSTRHRVLAALDETILLLERYPELGPKEQGLPSRSDVEVRRFSLSGFPKYIIVYALTDTTLTIMRVLHGARDPKLRIVDPA